MEEQKLLIKGKYSYRGRFYSVQDTGVCSFELIMFRSDKIVVVFCVIFAN